MMTGTISNIYCYKYQFHGKLIPKSYIYRSGKHQQNEALHTIYVIDCNNAISQHPF